MTAEIQMRDAARADLAAAVEAHLAAGGTIQRLSHCERAPHKPISYNNRVDRKSAGRREYLELERMIAEHGRALAATGLTVELARRQMAKRIAALDTFTLTLEGGGKALPVGPVAAKSFRRAALGAYRHYCGTFRNLDLPTWVLTDGTNRIAITELRAIDAGVLSVDDSKESAA